MICEKKRSASQAEFKRVGERLVPSAAQDTGPVLRGYSVPLHEPQPLLSPDAQFQDPRRISESPVEQEMLDYGLLTGEDLDLMTHGIALPNLGPNFHSPEALLDAVDHFGAYNAATSSGSQQHALNQQIEDAFEVVRNEGGNEHGFDDLDVDVDGTFDDQNEDDDNLVITPMNPDEDDPDPFMLEDGFNSTHDRDLTAVAPHLITIYALVSWLHLQFHLPRAACNALLAILGCIIVALSPAIDTPFITLQSSHRVLGVDKNIFVLPVCPTCRDVFPPAGSTKSHDTCTLCGVDLFLPDMTKRGNQRATKTPIVKYPYLPISEQIKSLLRIPGLEALLDSWRLKSRTPGEYIDIFDGDICWTQLKDPNGTPFFSNLPHEKHGPHAKPQAFEQDAFRPRTNQEQRELGDRYRRLDNSTARKNFVKEYATRYMQLARLPYFDLVKQIVIDLMHNLFLGLVKTHFYNIWVQNKILRANHELQTFHEMLADFIVPGSCGKLPTNIGMPSGGSLTADQWLLLATVYGPIVISQLWSTCLPSDADDEVLQQRVARIKIIEADKDVQANRKADDRKALAEAKKQGKDALEAAKSKIAQEKIAAAEAKKQAKLQAALAKQVEKERLAKEKSARKGSKKRKATSQIVEDLPEGSVRPPPPPPQSARTTQAVEADDLEDPKFSLHPDDPANFLKLSAALRILIQRKLSDDDIDRADTLIREYNVELIHLYGSGVIKPNHHFATHVGACCRNFGPLHDFWTFLFERLNKVLKSFKTNNHANGDLETTFFREFQRTCEIGRLTYSLQSYPEDSLPRQAAMHMLKATNEERGTVAGLTALTQDLDDTSADALATRQSKCHQTHIDYWHALFAFSFLSHLFTAATMLPLSLTAFP
ncbi:hypothetical protein EV424DRAFT_1353275 [Suillus variegatus]|nr:hypothetical protein EV424DRAFT_1353275 [Suillus variegatus]